MSNLRPHGHHTITPAFVVPNTAKVIGFLEKAFGAKVIDRYDGPGGAVMHAELEIGDSVIMCGEPTEAHEAMPASFTLYVSDAREVDATYSRALETGATSITKPVVQPWGYRSACVRDLGGNRWTICAVVEIVGRDEIIRRMSEGAKDA